jgi:hypothetical protein
MLVPLVTVWNDSNLLNFDDSSSFSIDFNWLDFMSKIFKQAYSVYLNLCSIIHSHSMLMSAIHSMPIFVCMPRVLLETKKENARDWKWLRNRQKASHAVVRRRRKEELKKLGIKCCHSLCLSRLIQFPPVFNHIAFQAPWLSHESDEEFSHSLTRLRVNCTWFNHCKVFWKLNSS